jgi:imidazolonepropionase-like amidohydrolase
MAGFTTVRDVGPPDLTDFQAGSLIDITLRNAINNGRVPGPRMLVAGLALGVPGGHCDDTGNIRPGLIQEPREEIGIANGPYGFRRAVRLAHKYGANVIKVCASGGVACCHPPTKRTLLSLRKRN